MSLSLRDVPFRFFMETIGDGRSKSAFKDFEHHLLEQFSNKFHEKPLVNKIHGREGHIEHEFSGNWNRPIDGRGKKYMWEIRPSKHNSWFKEFRDEWTAHAGHAVIGGRNRAIGFQLLVAKERTLACRRNPDAGSGEHPGPLPVSHDHLFALHNR